MFFQNWSYLCKKWTVLDREGTNSYSPTLQATDLAGNIGTTVVMINILDINDQTPEMYRELLRPCTRERNVRAYNPGNFMHIMVIEKAA